MQVYNFFRYSLRSDLLTAAAADIALKDYHPMRDIATRWMYHLPVFRRVEYLLPAILLALERVPTAVPDSAPAARDLQMQLRHAYFLLALVLCVPLMEPMQVVIKKLQDRSFGASSLSQLVRDAIARLQALFITTNTAFQGEPFAQWLALLKFDERKPLQNGMWLEEHRGYVRVCCKQPPAVQPSAEQASEVPAAVQHHWWLIGPADDDTGSDVPVRMKRQQLGAMAEHLKAVLRTEAQSLTEHLHARFPQCELLDAAGIIYPESLAGKDDAQVAIDAALAAAKIAEQLGMSKRLSSVSIASDEMLQPPIDTVKLQAQTRSFVSAVSGIATKVMALKSCEAPRVTEFWRRVKAAQGEQGMAQISEWQKLAEWSIVLLVGSVEDERRLSVLTFVKNKWRHALQEEHTDACLRVKCNHFYEELEDVPYARVLQAWTDVKDRRKLQ